MTQNRYSTFLQYLVSLFPGMILILGCASTGAPPGGPVDKTPPEIISTSPPNEMTSVDRNQEIQLTFDEPVRRETLAQAFSLSPPPPGTIRAKWRGNSVIFTPSDPLEEDQTYLLSLSSELSDVRGNKLKQSFHLAFSTGEKLDQGMIAGKLFLDDGEPQGWTVAAFFLGEAKHVPGNEHERDAADHTRTLRKKPDPSVEIPNATTNTGIDGSWQLGHIRPGRWRVFLYDDRNLDRFWTPKNEPVAVPSTDLTVSEDTLEAAFLSSFNDGLYSLPSLIRAYALSRDILLLQFDRPPPQINDLKISRGKSSVYSFSGIPDTTLSIQYQPGDSSKIRIRFPSEIDQDSLLLKVQGYLGSDSELDTSLSIGLPTVTNPDTIPPELIRFDPPPGSVLYRQEPIRVTFSEEMNFPDTSFCFQLQDESDSSGIPVSFEEVNLLQWISTSPWQLRSDLLFRIEETVVRDLAGNALGDSMMIFQYSFLPEDSIGSVSGSILGLETNAPVHLRLRPLEKELVPVELEVENPGSFHFLRVPAGYWQLEGWQDFDRNGVFSHGRVWPLIPSDPFTRASDSVFVRARWESAEEQLYFR